MSHFFVHLPSNSSHSYYPENTRAHFYTRLLKTVELKGDWEVGLSEILFSKTWYNVKSGEGFDIICRDCKSQDSGSLLEFRNLHYTVNISEGRYTSTEEIVNEMNLKMRRFAENINTPSFKDDDPIRKALFRWPTFNYDPKSNKVEIGVMKGLRVTLTDGLRQLLGFQKSSMPIKAQGRSEYSIIASDFTADANNGLEAFYVYCDILECIPVGDTEAPLLRIVDSGAERQGTLVRRHYETPLYVPVQKKNFDTIEVDIRTDTGEPVPFERGKVILTLHFRKSDGNYYI